MIQRTRGSWLIVMPVLVLTSIPGYADGGRDRPADRSNGVIVVDSATTEQRGDASLARVRVVDLRRLGNPGDEQAYDFEAAEGWLDYEAQAVPDSGALTAQWRRDWGYYRSRPRFLRYYAPYGYGYFGGTDLFGARRALEESYYAGRWDERHDAQRRFNRRDMARRKERLLDKHEQALNAGLTKLKEGDYARAVVALTLAGELNNGDPACRIHLAQARLAMGQYPEAGRVLRRALELQPKLVYMDLKLDKYYPEEGKLDECAETLARWIDKNPARADVHFLLGYLEFQRGHFDRAYEAFRKVQRVMPDDRLTQSYLEIARPAAD